MKIIVKTLAQLMLATFLSFGVLGVAKYEPFVLPRTMTIVRLEHHKEYMAEHFWRYFGIKSKWSFFLLTLCSLLIFYVFSILWLTEEASLRHCSFGGCY